MNKKSGGWEKRHLRDLVHIKHGYAFKGEHIGSTGPYVLVTPGNFFEEGGFKRNGNKQKRYSGAVPVEYILPAGSLIVAMTEQAEGLLGSAAIVPDDEIYLHNQRIGLVTGENINNDFLYYLLNTPTIRQQIRASSSGTKVRHTSPSRIGEVTAWLPTLSVQGRIAAILSAYDHLMAVNHRRMAILEDMARRVFDEWFVLFRYPGHDAVPLVETELGMTPQGWDVETARNVLKYIGGGTPAKTEPAYWHDGDIQWFTPTDLTKSGQTFLSRSSLRISKAGLAKSSARLFPAYSIMMTSRATLGVFAINTEPATTNQGFITFIPDRRTPVYFLFHLLKREFPRMEAVASGATFKEITKGALGELLFSFPPEHLAQRFEQLVTPMMEQIALISQQNVRLRAARNLSLAKLLSGEIGISAVEETFVEAAE